MKTPFIYGEIATGLNFTDRQDETKHLVINFRSLINTIIISPRRWGKSSLVHKAGEIAMKEEKRLRICHIDLFNVRNETHFYELFAQKVIAATSSRWDEVIEMAKNFMGRIVPKLTMSDATGSNLAFDFSFDKSDFNPDYILDLPEKIAIDKKIRLMVCIDEFQKIAELKEGDYILRRLRSHWQHHHDVGYCLYGSKLHMMTSIFNLPSQPFYRFGDMILLKKISRQNWIPFLVERFKDTGKEISHEHAALIAEMVDNHPYYCQQLAQLTWLRTEISCSENTIKEAHKALVDQLSLGFENLTDELTPQQIAYMHALVNDVSSITSADSMLTYGISSSTAAQRSRESLLKLDIIDKTGGKIEFQDPLYLYWLKNIYFA